MFSILCELCGMLLDNNVNKVKGTGNLQLHHVACGNPQYGG